MPIYHFKCPVCGEEIEKLQKHNDDNPYCPNMNPEVSSVPLSEFPSEELKNEGCDRMEKMLTTPAFNFKNGKGTTTGLRMNIAAKR